MGITIEECRTCKHAFTTGKDRWYCKKSLADKDDCGEYEMAIKALEKEPKYCDRNICMQNEYNGIGCDECEVTKSQEPKSGHWIVTIEDWKNWNIYVHLGYDFCPKCGVKMGGVKMEDQE